MKDRHWLWPTLKRKKITMLKVAAAAGCSQSNASSFMAGVHSSYRVARAISRLAGVPLADLVDPDAAPLDGVPDLALIRAALDGFGITQEEVAAKAGCTQENVSMFFTGRNRSKLVAKAIAEYLKIPLEDLLVKEEEEAA